MQETEALTIMSALAQSTRLKVLVLLSGPGSAGMASSDIADAVGVPRHLMSAHLAVLSRAGVVETQKAGRTVSYSVRRSAIRKLNAYLEALAETSTDPS
jgi:ArsR family transcriptional regulator